MNIFDSIAQSFWYLPNQSLLMDLQLNANKKCNSDNF